MNGRDKYNLSMTMQTQKLLSAYQKQISQLDTKANNTSVLKGAYMDISPLCFNLGVHNFEKKSSQQAAFEPGEKIGIWKDPACFRKQLQSI